MSAYRQSSRCLKFLVVSNFEAFSRVMQMESAVTLTCPCNIQIFFCSRKKMNISFGKNLKFSNIFFFKTLIVGEAVLTSTLYLCFGSQIRKKDTPLYKPILQWGIMWYTLVFLSWWPLPLKSSPTLCALHYDTCIMENLRWCFEYFLDYVTYTIT